MIEALFTEFWKPALVILCGFLLWTYVRIEETRIDKLQTQVAQRDAQLALDASEIATQNAAVEALKEVGDKAQAQIDAQAKTNTDKAAKVVVQWKTKYVPQPVPADCAAAVAVAAVNAASVASEFQSTP